MSPLRKAIAERLLQAQKTMAISTTFNEIDMSSIVAIRKQYQESFTKQHNVRLGMLSFFIKATVMALQAFPIIHASIEGDEIIHHQDFDIGVAVASEKGLVVPVVRRCHDLSFAEIEQQIESMSKKAREGKLSIDELQGGSFTITNGGVYGSMLSTPIINPPQSAILGLHKVTERPIAVDDAVVIRPMMYVALSYNHCLIDGREAVSFLALIKSLLEEPSRLLLKII